MLAGLLVPEDVPVVFGLVAGAVVAVLAGVVLVGAVVVGAVVAAGVVVAVPASFFCA